MPEIAVVVPTYSEAGNVRELPHARSRIGAGSSPSSTMTLRMGRQRSCASWRNWTSECDGFNRIGAFRRTFMSRSQVIPALTSIRGMAGGPLPFSLIPAVAQPKMTIGTDRHDSTRRWKCRAAAGSGARGLTVVADPARDEGKAV